MPQRRSFSMLFVLAALGVGCSHTPFVPTGGVLLNGSSANFSEDAVVGPNVSIHRTGEDSWTGILYDQPLDVTVTPDTLQGASLRLIQQRWTDYTRISGLWFNSVVKMELTANRILLEVAGNGSEYVRLPDGTWQGTSSAIPYALHLVGDAEGAQKPWPQFALAVLATGTNPTARRLLPGQAPKLYFGSAPFR